VIIAQPNHNVLRLTVDLIHQQHLVIALLDQRLVDTYLVNPIQLSYFAL
jgi:hypothetical protein